MKIGSHVSMSAPNYLLGAVKEAQSYGANAMMIYSGAPQTTKRVPTSKFKIKEAYEYMQETDFNPENIILHAPYIINLGNTIKPETFQLAVDFLKQEIKRAQDLKVKIIVLHPGSHVQMGSEVGLKKIVEGLDLAMEDMQDVVIALETMAGKGSECGRTFEEINYILQNAKYKDSLGVCLDTCHIWDAGYDLNVFEDVLEQFDNIIGIDKLSVLHINDSKNVLGAKKDRHENIGFGNIGFDNLMQVIYHPKLQHLVKILETPYIDGIPPYKEEIVMIKSKQFNPNLKELILENHKKPE